MAGSGCLEMAGHGHWCAARNRTDQADTLNRKSSFQRLEMCSTPKPVNEFSSRIVFGSHSSSLAVIGGPERPALGLRLRVIRTAASAFRSDPWRSYGLRISMMCGALVRTGSELSC